MGLLSRLFSRRQGADPELDGETLAGWVRDGYDHHVRGNSEQAQRLFQQVLEHDPRHADALFFLGAVAAADRRELEAIHYLERAVEARPQDARFHFALGSALFDCGRFEEAIPHFRTAARLQPDHPDAIGNLWMATFESSLRGGERREEELRIEVERAKREGREDPYIEVILAGIYRNHGRIEESIAALRKLLQWTPDNSDSYSDLLLTLNYSESLSPREIYEEHRRYAARFARPYVSPPPDRSGPRRLRIGYVSPDFRSHVVALFLEPIIELHDRGRFEVYCYYNHRREDDFTAHFRAMADHWRDCVELTDAALADRIRDDRIDILVDLAGHTGHNRLRVFAMKPAPVQVTYLGYPNTTGLSAIDYRITDALADPPGEADRMSAETLVRLPRCFHCFRPRPDSPDVSPLPAAATGQVTFGCFNNFAKLSEGFFDAAIAILKAVPGSRLWLKAQPLDTPYVAERVRRRFAQAGIAPERLELTGWLAFFGDHMKAYHSVDIALDSFPYNGTTTTCEALWMGVPVVTVEGDRHAARVGSSLLHSVGLEELVAKDVAGYVEICRRLAGDLERLAGLRSGLRERMRRSPLRDERAFVGVLERRYLDMWQTCIAGRASGRLGAGAVADLLGRAAAARAQGRTAEAGDLYGDVLLDTPDHPEALTALWDISFETGNPGSAVDWLNKAISARGDVAAFHYMLGCSLQAQGKVADAIASFSRAVELDPQHAKAHNNLGCVLEAAGDLDRALACYSRAVALDPRFATALYNQGNAYRQAGDLVRAIDAIRQAIAIDPGHADWHSNLGDLLLDRLQLDEAVTSFRAALERDARHARASCGLGLALLVLGRPAQAVEAFRSALEADGQFARARSNLLFALHSLRAEEQSFMLEEHRAWDRRHARVPWQSVRADETRLAPARLRIGYVSPDFCRHPVAHFIEPVLAAHDRARFHVIGYSCSAQRDEVSARFERLCEHWRDVSRLTDGQIADRIRFDGIDILVDLAGHTGGGRPALFAMKPAPVQVTWLGYPNTTGLRAMDYRLTDALTDPPGAAERFHTEKLVRLPGGFLCYRPPEDAPQAVRPPCLDSGRVTFGSFNNLSKVTDDMIALWARLLEEVPGSRLLMKAYGLSAESARRDFGARFAARGIGADRLRLLPPERAHRDHLARYNDIDVALDTFPYNGTTTTCEALWMGVPVVSLAGNSHVSRVGLSLLERVGLADLVAAGPDEYVAKAAALARDARRLSGLREGLRQRLRSSPLLDAQRLTRELESAYLGMWDDHANRKEGAMRLHIGGMQKMAGWKILNIQPGPDVDYVGDCENLDMFADGSVDEIYASHVVEHLGYVEKLPRALAEFHRVLKQGGTAKISVPDFEVLCRLFLDPRRTKEERFYIMRMAFGGQTDPHDFHHVGLTFEILEDYLRNAGFSRVERAGEFGLFHDDSTIRYAGVPISLNVIAYK
jgi:predicted O-linked N-acetylglucosamine transferase (SPINDLY family)/predicted SAM-dependent methyltransferase